MSRLGSKPLALLRGLRGKVTRYLDRGENWNNDDPNSNGEWTLLDRIAPHVSVAVDIGANVGDWTARLLAANPSAIVHAFEASPRTFASLSRRYQKTPNVRLHSSGMGENPGHLPFHDYGANSGMSSFVSRAKAVGLTLERMVQVPVTTVDAFREEQKLDRLDLVKIDTEGFELPILRGMTATLQQHKVDLVQFEYGGTWLDACFSLAQANQWLEQHGYTLYRLRSDCVERVVYDTRRRESFKYANFLAVSSADRLEKWGVPVYRG